MAGARVHGLNHHRTSGRFEAARVGITPINYPRPLGRPEKEGRMATLLWILAVILVIAGIVMIIRGRLLAGIIAIIVGLLVGPGGVSIFNV